MEHMPNAMLGGVRQVRSLAECRNVFERLLGLRPVQADSRTAIYDLGQAFLRIEELESGAGAPFVSRLRPPWRPPAWP
jgi:hypothetical protein